MHPFMMALRSRRRPGCMRLFLWPAFATETLRAEEFSPAPRAFLASGLRPTQNSTSHRVLRCAEPSGRLRRPRFGRALCRPFRQTHRNGAPPQRWRAK